MPFIHNSNVVGGRGPRGTPLQYPEDYSVKEVATYLEKKDQENNVKPPLHASIALYYENKAKDLIRRRIHKFNLPLKEKLEVLKNRFNSSESRLYTDKEIELTKLDDVDDAEEKTDS